MFALPLFLLSDVAGSDAVAWLSGAAGWGFSIGGIALGWYAAAAYLPAAKVALRDGRAARPAEVRR
jgi:hypothetical protein